MEFRFLWVYLELGLRRLIGIPSLLGFVFVDLQKSTSPLTDLGLVNRALLPVHHRCGPRFGS